MKYPTHNNKKLTKEDRLLFDNLYKQFREFLHRDDLKSMDTEVEIRNDNIQLDMSETKEEDEP